jgi:F0F1-type ATP synthase beta subunit
VVQSHFQVNLTALATVYIIANDLDDDGAQAVVDHLDSLAAPTAAILVDDIEEVLFLNAPPTGPLEP